MIYSLTWLASVLRAAGLKVAECDNWQSRGRREIGAIKGVICHHTGTKGGGNMPTLRVLIDGREDLAGPLAQLGLGRDGTYYVVAAGRCNHAGEGNWKGITDANACFIGIEAENAGDDSESWAPVQMEAYKHGVAAILGHIGQGAEWCIGHREYAPHRKTDPDFNMDVFRQGVASILAGNADPLTLIPASEPAPANAQGTSRATLRRGAFGALVTQVQQKLGVDADGNFGAQTEAAVRQYQRDRGMVPDGIVGPKTWAALDN